MKEQIKNLYANYLNLNHQARKARKARRERRSEMYLITISNIGLWKLRIWINIPLK